MSLLPSSSSYGVLHPDAVYLTSRGDVELRAAGELFMLAPYLP